ncbi:MAG: 30S ribosomal protein S20 [Candidatus Harrisonbacteria bacterium]|nr:30S ribosomal protein S20 [Candidatus Harrisonbacteria bacterium]MBI2406487.1 30S ribosomal protein S20 [Candidatus Harrisonbacteria bacterium]MBI2604080.1 30S ribosomal protein S20 [Candidatus Harrisonbacteria bacterium]MBI3114434.1 30S ribosomal protein S20 [Candidatus Harrisonbacteria bacterium]
MPITSSAKKALRQSKRRAAQNLAKKEAYKDALKKLRKLVAAKNMDAAKTALQEAYQKIDKAAKTGVVHRNTAGRLKSRAAKLLSR